MDLTLRFLGGAGSVTGSRFLVDWGTRRVLIDCGLFQGPRALRERNWEPFPVPPDSIERVILTHAHIDHTGYLPRLVKDGYRRPVRATPATCDLLELMLPDAGHLQEEEAGWHNRHRTSRHRPALPLFTESDARRSLDLLRPLPYDHGLDLGGGLSLRLRRAGHILGSAMVEFTRDAPGGVPDLLFTGDLGRPGQPILKDPDRVRGADTLVLESTYGGRTHGHDDPRNDLERIIKHAVEQRGMVLIPAFAIGRTQTLLYLLNDLQEAGRIPTLPIYVDSPMAIHAVSLYCRHTEDHDLDMQALMHENCPIRPSNMTCVRDVEESKALNDLTGPAIIISAAGMLTGGRSVHHLRHRLGDPRNTILLVGYQAQGTRGRLLQDGAREVEIYGQRIRVQAQIRTLSGLSAHADEEEILEWLGGFATPPRQTWLVHGEPEAAAALATTIRERLGWRVDVAAHLAGVELPPSAQPSMR